ncbi:hypothetical protein Moror_11316 [Moniliophthora roreri MCA 2997]|uniref:Uncharacterized protein n=1 Tax=Moniliophthora roreri (strain MCA 2997) TaxID=1381753 RepID=V2WXP1_MONRO|nr:hypothetical protein Moror_11316 [Moniliophthora roreri MCA 2997]
MFLRTVLSQSRAVAAAKFTRSFHSPFVVLGASNTTLEQPSPSSYEKQYDSSLETDTPNVHVVSPRSEGTYYHVPTGAYSNSTPFASAEESWAQRKNRNARK